MTIISFDPAGSRKHVVLAGAKLMFLIFALPISLLFMGFLGWLDSKQQERKRKDVDIRK